MFPAGIDTPGSKLRTLFAPILRFFELVRGFPAQTRFTRPLRLAPEA
jgi:hypothetical protein